MPKAQFHFENLVLPLNIAVAWAVLLKDYAASPHISFFWTDLAVGANSPNKVKLIDLVLEQDEKLDRLSRYIGKELAIESTRNLSSQLSSFRTHLCITHLNDEALSDDNKYEGREKVKEGDRCLEKPEVELKITCRFLDQGHNFQVVASSESITDDQVFRILEQFEQVLHQVCLPTMKGEMIYKIETASKSDVRDIWKWNSHVPETEKRNVVDMFSYHMKHNPNALAVNAWDGNLTYQELDDLSTNLSLRLIDFGAQQGHIVPLCFEKSMWTPVAVLAVIKTGAAFVLLDEQLPVERLRQVVNLLDQKNLLVLASAAQYYRAVNIAFAVIVVDSRFFEIGQTPHDRTVNKPMETSDLLYVVFTSGTTGIPKAAMIRHSNMCSFVVTWRALVMVTNESRILAWASYAFDFSVADIFLSLLSGACLCIPSSWECKNDVACLLRNYKITHVHITPSVAKIFQPAEAPYLKALLIGGEQCSEDVLARWRGSGKRAVNSYGPAECTVVSVANESLLDSARASIIGKGLGGCWIMDAVDRHRLIPVGGIGELVLEGPLVGGGYLHDLASTQDKFFEDPEWLVNGLREVSPGRKGRLYRTGDLVRYTDHGLIEFIGRRDLQVKIRGQRLELDELATHLQELMPTSVRWCPEVAKLNNGAELLIVFLVFPEDAMYGTAKSLRATIDLVDCELRRRLQPVMIPSAYTCIDQIPLSLSGKTDHRKLKEIASSLNANQLIFPQTNLCHLENANDKENASIDDSKIETMTLLWSKVLKIEPGDIHPSDTFFKHGGESLTAIKLVGAAAQRGIQMDFAMIFKYPRLSDLALMCKLVPNTSSEVPELFSLLKDKSVLLEVAKSCGISANAIEDAYPCTPMQEGLMTADNRQGTKYIGRGVLNLPRNIDPQRLAHAWQRVYATHSIFRTRIVDTESHGLLQVVIKDGAVFSNKDRLNLTSHSEDSHMKMGFGTPLCCWSFVRKPLSTNFILTMHHALYDGWTLQRVGAEVFKAYQGVRIWPAVGFNTFIQHISMLPKNKARDFWAQQLAEPEKTTFFPTLPHSVQVPRADSVVSKTFAVPENANSSISIPSLLRAAWALLVSKLSGTDDVTFGVTVSGRNIPISGIEDLLSPTISTVPVRVKLNGKDTTKEFVARVQNEALEAVPFENMGLQNIRKIGLDTREGSQFQTLFIVHPPSADLSELPIDSDPDERELKSMLESLNISGYLSDFNEYALLVLITQKAGNLIVEASYDSRVLKTIQVSLLLDQFSHVTQQLGCQSNRDRSLEKLDLASNSDLEAIWKWNSKHFEGKQETIPDVIAKTIALQPDAEAICAWNGSATFTDVDQLSLRLAQVLYKNGVRRGSLVPICMEKSIWATIAMLGIMRAGAGFVALDVRHQPEQRLRTIIEQVRADWIVTAGPAIKLAQRLCKGVIACDYLIAKEIEADYNNFLTMVSPSPEDTAFVVFTSGSTGIPKGIIITHENFCSLIPYHEREMRLSKTSRIYDFASYSFDIAVHNALMALAVGGCLCVPSEDARENDIEGSFEDLKANWADITPSVALLIDPVAVPGLTTLILSGEAIPKHLVSRWASKVYLINAYGPAEGQICTIQPSLLLPGDAANIGRGVGCSTWIVDFESQTLSLIGAVGELVIEGPNVSPGYLNTSSKSFVKDPSWLLQGFATVPGRQGTVYRTGDLARYQADGTIVYVGRATTQTKINGQRVELNEIEFHVQQAFPDSRDVVVDFIAFEDGLTHLCVFIPFHQSSVTTSRSLSAGSHLSVELVAPPSGIQDKLKRVLPKYMIPSVFFNISHIPLTATMKVDRQRLKSVAAKINRHEVVSIHQHQEHVGEHELDQKQQTMMFLWSQVLKLQFSKIGLESDFFQLGGDSILAMRLVKQARKQDLIFTVADVHRSPRFENLCDIAVEDKEDEFYLKTDCDTVQPFALLPVGDKSALIKSAAESCNVNPMDVEDIYPCTPFQEGVFALTATQGSDAYVQHTELQISEKYDIERVLAAWDSVIASNSILRTRIIQSDKGSLMQVVIREAQKWHNFDSSKQDFMNSGRIPMGPGYPLSRFAISRNLSYAPPTYTIIWTIHHALYDSWTMGLLLRQVSRSYNAQNVVDFRPEYNVFVQFLNGQREQSERWWKSNLIGSSNAAVFPKKPLTDIETRESCLRRRVIPIPPLLPPGYTLAVLLRSAWAIVMARYTGGESVLFGEVHLGRNISIKGVESMRGPTISSVPVLVAIDQQETIKSMLDRIRETNIQMQAFEHLGMQNISRIDQDSKAACNFQTILVLRENEDKNVTDSIFQLESIDDIRNFNSWELMIIFHQSSNELVAEAIFKESTVSVELIDLLLWQHQSILHSLCSLPADSIIRQLDLTNEEDLSRIWDWNASAPETVDEYMHELVSKQAQRTPEGIAVFGHDGKMTYKELDEFSSNLASQLVDCGVGVNTIVPLCFEKSVLVPVAMLAVIKTGAAFSVMDVTYPENRLLVISKAMDARIILASSTQLQLAQRLVDNVFVVDDVSCRKVDRPKYHLNGAVSRDTNQIMYVCYTSGSTGEPKGVMVTHRNLASASIAQTRGLGFGIGDKVYDFSSHAFDANIWHTWWSLISGACLCIPSYHDRMQNLAGSITSFQTTKLFLTPSVARTIDPADIPTVDRLFLGGEAITKLDVSKWGEHLDLWCAYGPTETTPLSIFTRMHGPESASNIGRGIGIIPWICNPQNHNELMAIGAVGEMLLEGPLVTLGYRNQPEKTASTFIENPSFLTRGCKLIPGRFGRLYKTGDLVRYASDGTIEYIGRADTQIKLRGQRVELGEIEFHLKSAMIADSSVVCEVISHPSSGRPMLVAFCSFSSKTYEMDKATTRIFVSKRLPPYMLPEAFLTIPEIPKNPSGKINRQYLRDLGPQLLQGESRGISQHPAGPRTRKEAILEELWVASLNQPNLVLHQDSDFFEIGGDSIAVMKLSNLARKSELTLTVRDIMQHSTLSSMAMKADYAHVSSDSPKPFSLVEPSQLEETLAKAAKICGISVESISDVYPCTPLQIELFALTLKQPQAYISRSVFEVPDHINFSTLVRAWNTVIGVNAILRTRFVDIKGIGLTQIVVKQQFCEIFDSFERYLAMNPVQADLGSPLSQIAGIQDEKSPKIVWTIHHGLYDAWSIQILENQLRKAYLHQRVTSPPAYSAFIRHLRSQDLQKARDFWRLRLRGCKSAAIYPPLPSRNYQVRPCTTFKRVMRTSIEPGTNLQATIHVAWALIVSKLSAVDDVVFAATLTGRDIPVPDVEQMVGATITPVPIRIKLSNPEQSIHDLAEITGQETASMAPYQHIGTKTIGLIDSDTQAACKFQTLLVLTPSYTNLSTGSDTDAISTSTYEICSEKQEAFHTFALVLFFTPTQDGLALEAIFDSAVLNHREVERLSGRLESVINIFGQGRSNNARVSDIECLGKDDLHDVWNWNAELPLASEQLLHNVILNCVQHGTDKIAIDAWDIKISYSQLDTLSKNLASHLRKHAVGRGSIVPILSFKSGYVAVAALAVLRTGAAILPLDASQPLKRLQAIVKQLHSNVILADRLSTQAAANIGTTVLCIQDSLDEAKNVDNLSNSAITATPDDIACILWTSGSTGVPKGVMQTHRALSSAILHQTATSSFNETTRAFEFASYSFDVSWNMIFKILAVGGTLCVPNEDEIQNDLVGALNRSAATLTELTASVAHLINPDQLSTLETLILSGEFVDLRDFEHWTPKVRLIICYGPSECTSVSTINTSGSNSDGIGKAISCRTWIVDPQNHRRLMPVGAVGEILIEGPNIGKGYYNNQVATNISYVSDLPWLESGYESRPGRSCIAFKSGDLARYDPNGNLHFISRKDTQVKLHGQRIELEEVQHHVKVIMGDVVGPVIATVLNEPNGNEQRLVVFLSCKTSLEVGLCTLVAPEISALAKVGTLDEKLKTILPKYMIPAVYYFTTTIPRTINGKIDRNRLVEIAKQAKPGQAYRGRPERLIAKRGPSTMAEFGMQRFLALALGIPIESIGADDDFFNLNGDSISAMRLVAAVRSEGYDLRVSDIFATPKLSDLALKIAPKAPTQKPAGNIPFSLLGDNVDVEAIRSEVASRCGLQESSLVEDVYPCTPLQESMLAATIKDPSAFTSMRVYRIPQQIDIVKFRAAWENVVDRNCILRTRLVDLKSYGISQVVIQSPILWHTYSTTHSFLEDSRREHMGLGSRLTRWALIKEENYYRLVWTIHHTTYDGWSLKIIEDEVRKAYFGQLLLPPEPDMRSLVKYLRQQDEEMSLKFWKQELKIGTESAIFPLLPNTNYKPSPMSYLKKTMTVNMASLSSRNNLSALLYGSWTLLVSRITGNKMITCGLIRTGRAADVDLIDKIVGPTLTTVPIVVDMSSNPPVQDFMSNLRDMTVRMIPHEHIGIDKIRRISAATAAACSFQTVLVIQPPEEVSQQRSKDQPVMEELDETKIDGFPDQHAVLNQYGLMLEIQPKNSTTIVSVSFDSKLISISQADRLINQWEHTLKQLSQTLRQTPLAHIESLDFLSQQDVDTIWRWNKDIPEADDHFVHEVISEHAIARPEALALDSWDGQLTYKELEIYSSRLADYLVHSGIRPGCFVPLIFHKSMWANVSMLAVLKSGGTFVPFDAHLPEGRLRAIMQMLKPDVILCSAKTRDLATRLAPRTLIVDNSLRLGLTRENNYAISTVSTNKSGRIAKGSDLAYVTFSSGSTTGQPKAIKISHMNLATGIKYHAGAEGFLIDSDTRALDSSFYAFDACVCNFFYTLSQGGCLCVPSEDSLKGDIGAFMRDYNVNWAVLVPSTARTISPGSVPTLSRLILTGEAITQGDIDTWSHSVHLLNAYGPTECTILCAISPQLTTHAEVGIIGRGRGANLWLAEIGNPNKLAPIGLEGEILIEGPIVGAGYLSPYKYPLVIDPPWLTAGTNDNPGRRGTLFRTGDQARYNEDGTLVFVGRIGSEIKLRGQRVDLMEIEDLVRRHNTAQLEVVADIIRIDSGERSKDRQILVLFVANASANHTVSQDKFNEKLREWSPNLKAALDTYTPSYMHPEAYVPLQSIPKTISGKTDRRRLKHVGKFLRLEQLIWINDNVAKGSGTPPSTPEEKLLASFWAKILEINVQFISREDDFFYLGGNSIGVMRLITVAHEHNRILKAKDVFTNSKLAQLAQKMIEVTSVTNGVCHDNRYSLITAISDLEALIKEIVEPSLEVSRNQIEDIVPANGFQIDYINNKDEPLGLQYVYLDISPEISWPKLVEACRTVVQMFQCLRSRFIFHNEKYYQVFLRDAPILVEEIVANDQMTTFFNRFCAEDCRKVAITDVFTKVSLVKTDGCQRRVILRMSHLQRDGWCIAPVFNAIASVFNGRKLNRVPDWTQVLYYRNQIANESYKYWRSILEGTTGTTPPLIFKPRTETVPIRTLQTFAIPNFHSTTDNRRTRPTVVINVAWALVLQQLAGHRDIVIGNVTTGRNGTMPGLDSVVGPCVNMVPMRINLSVGCNTKTRAHQLINLVDACAQQVDERTSFEGLDWDDMVNQSTTWTTGMRYSSSIHFRNMEFEPELLLGTERLTVAWKELVARPQWTTVLVYPEDDVLRLWLLANPEEIGSDGADDILHLLAKYVEEIVIAIEEDLNEVI